MNEHLNELLSAYLDDELSAADRVRAEEHLAACAQCRTELESLRRVVRRAGSLDDRPPERDLWAGIAGRLGTPDTADVVPLASRRRRITFTVPQLAAAALALMMLSAGAVSLMVHRDTPAVARTPEAAQGAATVRTVFDPGAVISTSYEAPIAELQQALAARRGRLDTATVRVVEQSLQLIDRAIRQAQQALARDPGNQYLNSHLQRAYDRKLELLRQAATLPVVS